MASVLSAISALASFGTLVIAVRVGFFLGRMDERQAQIERRLARLEKLEDRL